MRKYTSTVKSFLLSLLIFLSVLDLVKAGDPPQKYEGINFRSITFEEALKASKKEKKPIFIHGYADWCFYCKYMADSVYPNKEVGDFYNKNFISLKINLEKEGAEMNKVVKGHSFPVLLFYDTTGEIMHRAAGRRYKLPFLELGKQALDTNQQMRAYKNKFEAGTATPWEVQYYFRIQEVAGMDAQPMLNDYMMKQPDSALGNANNWRIIYDILKDPTLPIMKRVIDSQKELLKEHSADSLNNKFINTFNTYLMQYVQQMDSFGYENAKQKIRSMKGLTQAEKICAFADLNKHKMKSEWEIYKVEGRKFLTQYATDDYRRINEVVGNFTDRFGLDKELMAFSESFILRSVNVFDNYRGNHLLATVSANLGKKEQAFKAATHAIELASLENKDFSSTTQLMTFIQKMP